jgi:hypothetical protein
MKGSLRLSGKIILIPGYLAKKGRSPIFSQDKLYEGIRGNLKTPLIQGDGLELGYQFPDPGPGMHRHVGVVADLVYL